MRQRGIMTGLGALMLAVLPSCVKQYVGLEAGRITPQNAAQQDQEPGNTLGVVYGTRPSAGTGAGVRTSVKAFTTSGPGSETESTLARLSATYEAGNDKFQAFAGGGLTTLMEDSEMTTSWGETFNRSNETIGAHLLAGVRYTPSSKFWLEATAAYDAFPPSENVGDAFEAAVALGFGF